MVSSINFILASTFSSCNFLPTCRPIGGPIINHFVKIYLIRHLYVVPASQQLRGDSQFHPPSHFLPYTVLPHYITLKTPRRVIHYTPTHRQDRCGTAQCGVAGVNNIITSLGVNFSFYF